MRRYLLPFLGLIALAGCAANAPEVKRLNPVMGTSKIPSQCQIVSILMDSPADKAGLSVGDVLKSVNGKVPATVGVPVMAPVDALIESPVGSAPTLME